MSRSKSSVLTAVAVVSLLALSVFAVPAQAIGPAGPETIRSGSWFDFSFTVWVDEVVARWFGGTVERGEGFSSSNDEPSQVSERSGHLLDPDGVEADSVTPDPGMGLELGEMAP